MLFNSYAFLLVFLPARHPDLSPRRSLSAIADAGADRPVARLLQLLGRALSAVADRLDPDQLAGRKISTSPTKRGVVVTAAIVANLAVLGFFKYTNFFAETFASLSGIPIGPFALVLPLGISFFTFHHIMYLVDLRRGKAPEYPLDRYALYIAFFPQAIAGPLVRWSEVMHQFGRAGLRARLAAPVRARRDLHRDRPDREDAARRSDRAPDRSDLCAGQDRAGAGRAIHGSRSASRSRSCSISPATPTSRSGLALLFGVQLPYNFNAPLRSTSVQDLWQRWHMTLMTFLRDYLFHPLANARIGARPPPAAAFRRHDPHHGAVRTVARPELDLRAVGHAARLRAGDRRRCGGATAGACRACSAGR